MNRLIVRGPNPFAPIAKIKNSQLTAGSPYQALKSRAKPLLKDQEILDSVESLRQRLEGEIYNPVHFGRLENIDFELIDINIDIQRELENPHVASIIRLFDPRIIQPVNVIYIKETGRYSAWDGQQSSAVFAILYHFGLIDKNTKIQCKVIYDDLEVPGSDLVGEAVGNYGFRRLNGNGRQPVDAFFKHRSQVNGVRRYNSQLREDQQSEEIQCIMEQNNMFPAPTSDAKSGRAKPGMITYISGVNKIAGHDTEEASFEITKGDLDFALRWHNQYFNTEKGVDGGIILALGRLHAASRGHAETKNSSAEPRIVLTEQFGKELATIIRSRYLNPAGFHSACKERLKTWQSKNYIRPSWSDSCLTPFLVMDYVEHGGTQPVPMVSGMNLYAGV
jgi:hypothetical protein